MSDRRFFRLAHAQARKLAAECCLSAPDGWVVKISEPTRNLDQSAKFHAICNDISKAIPFAGKMRKPEQWKILLVSAHSVATKQGSEMVPGIEGEWCNLRESTASMGVARMASLIEYALAYCAENGIMLPSTAKEP